MCDYLDTNILKLAENLKSSINKCITENNRLLEIVNGFKSQSNCQPIPFTDLCANGDNHTVNRKPSIGKKTSNKSSHEDHLRTLIKNAAVENLRLRESNVKLKQESKVQDHKIRDLKHKLLLYERNSHKSQSQKLIIDDLKDVIEIKKSEITKLKLNLDNVLKMINREQSRARVTKVNRNGEYSVPNSKQNSEFHKITSEMESMLLKLHCIIDNNHQSYDNSCLNTKYNVQIDRIISGLQTIKSKLIKYERTRYAKNSSKISIAPEIKSTKSKTPCAKTYKDTNTSCLEILGISTIKCIKAKTPDNSNESEECSPIKSNFDFSFNMRRRRTKSI